MNKRTGTRIEGTLGDSETATETSISCQGIHNRYQKKKALYPQNVLVGIRPLLLTVDLSISARFINIPTLWYGMKYIAMRLNGLSVRCLSHVKEASPAA